jgi:hypothetical protein
MAKPLQIGRSLRPEQPGNATLIAIPKRLAAIHFLRPYFCHLCVLHHSEGG